MTSQKSNFLLTPPDDIDDSPKFYFSYFHSCKSEDFSHVKKIRLLNVDNTSKRRIFFQPCAIWVVYEDSKQ